MKLDLKKKFFFLLKVVGLVFLYLTVFVTSVFITMSTLIKGEELTAPDLTGINWAEAEIIAAKNNIYLNKTVGNYGRNYQPLTVINQVPVAGTRIKERSVIKLFVTSEVVEVDVPDLTGYNLAKSEALLREKGLKKRYVSYMDAEDVPVDFVISQSLPPGVKIPSGSEIDILVSRGNREVSYIMPDVIGEKEDNVVNYFVERGLKKPEIARVPYPGLEPGKVIKQYPLSGYRINNKARINIEVSQ